MVTMDKILKEISKIQVSVGKIEQHLKDINGSLLRHEGDIQRLDKDIVNNKVNIGKVMTITGLSGGGVGVGVFIILKLIGL